MACCEVLPRHLTETTETSASLAKDWPILEPRSQLFGPQLKYFVSSFKYNKIKHLKSKNNLNYVSRFTSTTQKTHAIPILTTLQMMCSVTYTDVIKG